MLVEFEGKKIEFEEVVDVFDSHGPYCQEVEVQGEDKNGVTYSAIAMYEFDEITEVEEDSIEVVE